MGGKPKWLPFKFGYHDVMRTSPIKALDISVGSVETIIHEPLNMLNVKKVPAR